MVSHVQDSSWKSAAGSVATPKGCWTSSRQQEPGTGWTPGSRDWPKFRDIELKWAEHAEMAVLKMVWILNMWDLENSSRSNHTSETFLSTACLCGCTCGRFLGWCAFVVCVCVLSFYFYAQSQIIYKRSNLALMSMWMWTLLCHLVTVHFRVHFTGSWFCSLAGMYMYEGETKAMQAHAMRVYVVQKQ